MLDKASEFLNSNMISSGVGYIENNDAFNLILFEATNIIVRSHTSKYSPCRKLELSLESGSKSS